MWTSDYEVGEQPKPGLCVARFFKIIELGTQTTTYEGKTTRNKKVLISFELAPPLMNDGQPFAISKEFTQSLGEQAALRKYLEAWAGKPMTEDQHKNFDPKSLLGKACYLIIGLTAGGKAKITGMTSIHAGVEKPALVNPTSYFSMDHFDFDAFQAMPGWIKAKIESSPEFKKLNNHDDDNGASIGNPPVDDDSIPF